MAIFDSLPFPIRRAIADYPLGHNIHKIKAEWMCAKARGRTAEWFVAKLEKRAVELVTVKRIARARAGDGKVTAADLGL